MKYLLLCLLACNPGKSSVEDTGRPAEEVGNGKRPHFPFPSMHMMNEGRIALPEDLPTAIGGTRIPIEKLSWRSGFSVAQSVIIDLDVVVDPESLPSQSNPERHGSIQLWDLTAGEAILSFTEVDAADPVEGEYPVLIVRPQEVMTPGHQIAVVVTDRVTTATGEPVDMVPWYRDILADRPGPGLSGWTDHYRSLQSSLETLGVSGIRLAFDFPIADGGDPVRHVVDSLSTPGSYRFDDVRRTDDGILMPEGGWIQIRGTYTTDNWLIDDLHTEIDSLGNPIKQGVVESELRVYIPESARSAEPGTVPVWIFGHGLFEKPDTYLARVEDTSKVAQLADEAGAIVFATVWRGFKDSDRIHAIDIANDFGRINEITERLIQGISNVSALSKLILDGDILSDPALLGLPDINGEIRYYGISLGGIAGAVTIANNPRIGHAVFNVGGGAWSTMLERSSQWIPFDWLMIEQVPSPRNRQLLYALSQLFWDPVDPMNHIEALRGRSILWQEAIGDEQVPNMTTRMLARAVGATLLEPFVEAVPELTSAVEPFSGPAIAQYDPMTEKPFEANTPGVPTGAHSIVRTWPGCRQQIAHFNDWNSPGQVQHFCGDEPCTSNNPGL